MTKEEKERVRKEKIASFFLDLGKLTFAASVLGGLTPLLTKNSFLDWLGVILGVIVTVIFAGIGNKFLK